MSAGIGAALDRRAGELGEHRLELVGVADPDRDGPALGEADEPRVAAVLGRAGLARGELARAERGAAAGALRDDRGHDPDGLVGDAALEDRACAASCSLERLAARALDLCDARPGRRRSAPSVPPTRRPPLDERLVGVGHVQRRDALLEAAERHRVVRRDRRADAHALAPARAIFFGPDRDADRRVDGVVGVGQAARERLRARVLALEVVDDELLAARSCPAR